jgi:hypothetical protein
MRLGIAQSISRFQTGMRLLLYQSINDHNM